MVSLGKHWACISALFPFLGSQPALGDYSQPAVSSVAKALPLSKGPVLVQLWVSWSKIGQISLSVSQF